MSDRQDTTGVRDLLDILRGEVARHHDRLNDHGSKLITLVGQDGKNGWRASVEKDVSDMKNDHKTLAGAVHDIQIAMEGQKIKLAAIVGLLSLIGSLAGGALLKLLVGG